jgi:translation initiation factor IF-3
MLPTHFSSTSRALYRVFVAPTLRTSSATLPIHYAPAFAPAFALSSTNPLSQTSIRTKTFKKDTSRHALSDHYVIDRAISASRVNLVDLKGQFRNDVPIGDALSSFNKITHHLVQILPGKVDEYGNHDPNHPPTCRVVSKMDLRTQHQQKLDILRRQAKGQSPGPSMKNLELNWAIASGDLKHRLEKMKSFLREGRKVEILLGPKKKSRKATPEEAESVLKAVRDAVGECKGSREVKSNGDVGGVLTIVLEGRKMETKKEEEVKSPSKASPEEHDSN